jgi:hypothetical protein
MRPRTSANNSIYVTAARAAAQKALAALNNGKVKGKSVKARLIE